MHVILDAVEDAGFFFIDMRKETGVLEVRLDISRRPAGELTRLLDDVFEHLCVEAAARRHAGHDADAADSHVGILVRDKDRRADTLVSAASRVGPIDSCEHRYARLGQFGMAEERRARPAPVGIEFFLLGQLRPAAVDEPHERDVQPVREVGDAQDVL